MTRMTGKVAILGGGIAGLTAAHELAERGFHVHVFEASAGFGGKARSFDVVGSAELHEGRIRLRDISEVLLAEKDPSPDARAWAEEHREDEAALNVELEQPRFVIDAALAIVAKITDRLPSEHGFHYFPGFYRHLIDTLERIPVGKHTFRRVCVADHLVAGTRVLVAREQPTTEISFTRSVRNPRDVEALMRSFLEMGLRPQEVVLIASKLFELWRATDQEWETKLEKVTWWDFIEADGQSVAYQTYFANVGVRSTVAMDPRKASARSIGRIVLRLFSDLAVSSTHDAPAADRFLNGPTQEAWFEPWLQYLDSLNVQRSTARRVVKINCVRGRVDELHFIHANGERSVERNFDYVISTLPPKQLAEVVRNSEGLRTSAPSMRRIEDLLENNTWMVGIQLYLEPQVLLSPGGIFLKDSPWAITLVPQTQFWTKKEYPYRGKTIRTVLSVIISDWNAPGDFYGKSAKGCTPTELKEEVWREIKAHFNDTPAFEGLRGRRIFSDADLVEWRVNNWDLYERRWENQEELFINGVNSLCLRPHANTEIDNFFVAGDYVRTSTDLATMESANEAARLAVNGVLEHYGASEPPCGVWKLEPVPREAVGALGALLTQVVGQAGKRAFQASAAVARSLSSTILNWRR